jgi:hypothetical protein
VAHEGRNAGAHVTVHNVAETTASDAFDCDTSALTSGAHRRLDHLAAKPCPSPETPYAKNLETAALPNEDRIALAVLATLDLG